MQSAARNRDASRAALDVGVLRHGERTDGDLARAELKINRFGGQIFRRESARARFEAYALKCSRGDKIEQNIQS